MVDQQWSDPEDLQPRKGSGYGSGQQPEPQPLDAVPGHRRFRDSSLLFSAGDADVYNLRRFILNRQSDYVVNFRSSLDRPMKRVIVHFDYNYEWNDIKQ